MTSMKNRIKNIAKKFIQAAVVITVASFAGFASADVGIDQGESYAEPTLRDLVQSSIMMDAYDLKKPAVIDDYAKLLYCDLYTAKYKNDFEWNNIRQDLITRISNKKEYYRILYQFSGPVFLGRYNFETQDFPFEKKTALLNVGVMEMLAPVTGVAKAPPSPCFSSSAVVMSFPMAYQVKLTEPLTIDRLKMPSGPSQALLARMQAQNNTDRKVYLRFRIKLANALRQDTKNTNKAFGMFVGQMTAVDVFLDKELTQYVASISLNKE